MISYVTEKMAEVVWGRTWESSVNSGSPETPLVRVSSLLDVASKDGTRRSLWKS
jgi:hypothetical protein